MKAADAFNPQGGPEAELWAKLACSRILEGNVSQVVKGLRQTVTKQGLFGSKRKTLTEVAAYFDNNKHRMRYHEYLAQGLPIASGPVEGACKNLIKNRMERSGMHWTESMAEAIVQLRAIYLNVNFLPYWSFHISKDQERLSTRPLGRGRKVATPIPCSNPITSIISFSRKRLQPLTSASPRPWSHMPDRSNC